ncbi:hypothetical protein [Rhizobium leguminosarum]|uniref:hypothetical protein n=1 Tax=Rhizobium leguminosarum TaxID=384 RepID=UPI001954A52B|nr:hypothetical protein [Rhizobium leguminosarum]MBY5441858.1 hypothetical protein [Rhizobium leguminosarum]
MSKTTNKFSPEVRARAIPKKRARWRSGLSNLSPAIQKRLSEASNANKFATTTRFPFTSTRIARNISDWAEAFGTTLDKLRSNGFRPLGSREDQS